jgi:hypothetical protein
MKNLKRRRTGQFLQDPLVSGRRNFRKKSEKNQLESHFLFYEHEVFEHQDKKNHVLCTSFICLESILF